MLYKPQLCIYDGITFFILYPYIEAHLLRNKRRYKLKYRYNSNKDITNIDGKFRNFTISLTVNPKGQGITIGGSLHKWKNTTHNHDVFLWTDFLKVYQEIVDEFNFVPQQADIQVLEGGLNNRSQQNWNYPMRYLIEHTIYLKGEPRATKTKKYPKGGFLMKNEKGFCSTIMYDKGSQFNLDHELLRCECSCKTKQIRKFGFYKFDDLLYNQNHTKLCKHLLKSFKTLLIFQPEILQNPLLSREEREFLLEHNNSRAWISIRKKSDYYFQKDKKTFLLLIDKYGEINYRAELINYMEAMLL